MSNSRAVRKIAVLGAGNVGGALARIWSKAGHSVVFGLPDPKGQRAQERLRSTPEIKATTNDAAAAQAEIVVLTVPWDAAQTAIEACGELTGKIIIDCTNPVSSDLKGLVIGTSTSAAEQVASWARGAHVVKAFNTIGAPCYGNARFGSETADGFFCGDDDAAKKTVQELIEQVGLHPADVGPLSNARWLEAIAMLWIDLAINRGQGVNHAFKLLRR
jgi:8-hydroxy-5-deazaflavin:NADPH oxidoreductase